MIVFDLVHSLIYTNTYIRNTLSCEHLRQHKNDKRKDDSLEFCYFHIDLQRRFGQSDKFDKLLNAIYNKFVYNNKKSYTSINNDENLAILINLTRNMPSNHQR